MEPVENADRAAERPSALAFAAIDRVVHVLSRMTSKRALLPVLDALLWVVALLTAVFLRYDLSLSAPDWGSVAYLVPVVVGLQIGFGYVTGLYRARARIGSFDEMISLFATFAATTVALLAIDLLAGRPAPAGAPLIAGPLALGGAIGIRYIWRAVSERALRPQGDGLTRLLIFGAGDTGTQITQHLRRNPDSHYLPVGFIDDAPARRRLRIAGVPVLGTRADLAAVVEATDAQALLLAAPSAPLEVVRDLARSAQSLGLIVRVLPSFDELIGEQLTVSAIRPLVDAELIGRVPTNGSAPAVAGAAIAGRRVLVTGAGGSIGSEICRQVAALAPTELVMLDRDESALHLVALGLHGHGLLDTSDLVVADVRDADRIDEVFDRHRPEVVFHAAALKHLPLLEQHPIEAVKTNVHGTDHVLDAASRAGTDRFVNVSTDKAANPVSVLGYTKRVAERLTAHHALATGCPYVSVRFGNVLGTRGSILTTFHHQIAAGGPVTVTDPEVTRYFMTVQEAVELVLQAAAIGEAGDALVLEMGEPVSIRHLAEQLIEGSGRPVGIQYTGLRPGEKLHEDLFADGEVARPTGHPLIARVAVPALDPVAVASLPGCTADETVAELLQLCEPRHARVP